MRAIVQPFQNSPATTRIRWYKAPAGAKVFPGRSFLSLGYWAWREYGWFGPGQVEGAPTQYDKGATPATARGQNYCGTLDEFANGLTYPLAGPIPRRDANGMPVCCLGAGPPVPLPPPPTPMPIYLTDVRFGQGEYPARWYTAGQSYTPGLGAGQTVPPNKLYAAPFSSPQGGTLKNIGAARATPGAPGDVYRLGIYKAQAGTYLPRDLVFDTGDIDATMPVGIDSVPCGVTLDQETLYWLVVAANVAGGLSLGAVPSSSMVPVFGFMDDYGTRTADAASGFTLPYVYNWLPGLFPGSPSQSDLDDFMAGNWPAVLVQYQ